jgi:hypothetical protein
VKKNLASLIKPFMDFINNKNNPTGVTAAQAGTYTQQEILNMLATKADVAALPIAYWGQSLDFVVSPTVNGTVLGINQVIPSLVGGVAQTMPATDVDFTVVQSAGAVVVHVYLEALGGVLRYVPYSNWMNESPSRIWLGTLTKSGSTWSYGQTFTSVVMLGGYRLSKTRKGSSIPVSTGEPTGAGVYLW